MTDYTDEQLRTMREQVLSAVLAIALRSVEAAERTEGAAVIRVVDTVDMHGLEWHITAQWDKGDDSVLLRGHPLTPQAVGEVVQAGPVLLLFGLGQAGQQFAYDVPVPWLRAVAVANDPRVA